jgi:hypothetical protein
MTTNKKSDEVSPDHKEVEAQELGSAVDQGAGNSPSIWFSFAAHFGMATGVLIASWIKITPFEPDPSSYACVGKSPMFFALSRRGGRGIQVC